MNNIIYLKGPVSVTEHYHPKYNKYLYIFGDLHRLPENPCGSKSGHHIRDFIVYLTRQGKKVDIFLEEPKRDAHDILMRWFNQSLGHKKSYLSDTIEYFTPYMQLRNRKSSQYFRAHYTDLRHICAYFSWRRHLIPCLVRNIIDRKVDGKSYWTPWKVLQYKIKNKDLYTVISNDMDQFIDDSGLKKEVNKLQKDSKEQRLLFSKLQESREAMIQWTIRLIQCLTNDVTDECHNLIAHKYEYLMEFMDIYVLARIFKKEEYKNIVIYAGDLHAHYYRKMLRELGFQTYYEYIDYEQHQCIEFKIPREYFYRRIP